MPIPKEIEEKIANIPYDKNEHRLSTGVYCRRYADQSVKFFAKVWGKNNYRYRERFDTYGEAKTAYERFVKQHNIKEMTLHDLTGKKFGHLIVLERVGTTIPVKWKCQCDLDGNVVDVLAANLTSGKQTTCGKHADIKSKLGQNKIREDVKNYGAVPGMLTQKKRKSNTSGVKGISVVTTKNGSKRYLAELSVGGKRYKGHRYEQLSDAIAERKAMERKYQQPILLRAKEELRAKEDKVMYKRAKAKIPQDKKYHWIETGIHALHLKSGKVNFSATVRKLSSGRRQVQTFESYSDAKDAYKKYKKLYPKRRMFFEDFTGRKIGKLTVIKRVKDDYHAPSGGYEPRWLCQCECGNTNIYRASKLRNGEAVTCGDRSRHNNLKSGYDKARVDGVPVFMYHAKAKSNTGYVGIIHRETKKGEDRYYASFKINGVLKLSKTFKTLDEAVAARKDAEEKYIPKRK
mgnify:CR=1 FL=1